MPTSFSPPLDERVTDDRVTDDGVGAQNHPEFATALVPKALRTLFQPIVQFGPNGWTVEALECLTRGPVGSRIENAPSLFAAAKVCGMAAELDRACVTTALETVMAFDIQYPLYINVDAETLIKETWFPTFLAAMAAGCEVPWARITLEITEHARDMDVERLAGAVRLLHEMGMRVAFDDFGPGMADARALAICHPDLVKIDASMLCAARNSSAARGVLERVVRLAERRGATIVAEGLERPADLLVVAELGIHLLQGHLLCPPLDADSARTADDRMAGRS